MSNKKDDWKDEEWDEYSNSSDEDDIVDDTEPDDEGEAKDDFVNDTDDEDASSNDANDNVVDAPTNPDEEEFESNSEDESDDQSEEDEFEEEQNNEEEVGLDEEYYNSDKQDDGNDGDKRAYDEAKEEELEEQQNGEEEDATDSDKSDKDDESEPSSKRSRHMNKDDESDRVSVVSSELHDIAQLYYKIWNVETTPKKNRLAQLSFKDVTIRHYNLVGIDRKGPKLQFDLGYLGIITLRWLFLHKEELFGAYTADLDSGVSRWVEITPKPSANVKLSEIVKFDSDAGILSITLPKNDE